MTPAARVAAAVECLDAIVAGEAAEKVLTGWARAHRFAGSKDRAAIRDHVFDVLRRWRSTAWCGGAETGRARMLGLLQQVGEDPAQIFTGEGYGPPPLAAGERTAFRPLSDAPDGVRLDWPDWLLDEARDALGDAFEPSLAAGRRRAPVFLRVNLARTSRAEMRRALSVAGIDASDHPEVETALRLAAPARGLSGLPAYQEGLIELQDAHSQAVVLALPLHPDQRVLDLCAGGGGKTLAIGALCPVRLFAHDGDPGRMRDLPARAIRAGQDVRILQLEEPETLAPFDLVLADVPCSGSGSWRRAPEGKWRLTPERYAALRAEQSAILDRAAALTAPKGWLAYVTCSVFDRENGEQAEAFLQRTPGWTRRMVKNWPIGEAGDGFHLSLFQKTD